MNATSPISTHAEAHGEATDNTEIVPAGPAGQVQSVVESARVASGVVGRADIDWVERRTN